MGRQHSEFGEREIRLHLVEKTQSARDAISRSQVAVSPTCRSLMLFAVGDLFTGRHHVSAERMGERNQRESVQRLPAQADTNGVVVSPREHRESSIELAVVDQSDGDLVEDRRQDQLVMLDFGFRREVNSIERLLGKV
jgi:hypothetical protein